MKTARSLFCSTILFGTALLLTSGCGTLSRQELSEQVSGSIENLRAMLYKGIAQTDTLQDSVKALSKAEAPDLRKAFETFEDEFESLEAIANEVRAVSEEMSDNTVEYFAGWEKDLKAISDSKLRKKGKERRASFMDEFSLIAEYMEKLEESYGKYERDIKDLQKFLGNDLTAAGSEIAQPYLKKAASSSPRIKRATKTVLDGITGVEALVK